MSEDPRAGGLPKADPDVDTIDSIAELETEGGRPAPAGRDAPHIEHADEPEPAQRAGRPHEA